MNDAREPSQNGQQDIDQKVTAAADFEEYTKRREDKRKARAAGQIKDNVFKLGDWVMANVHVLADV